MNPLVLAEELAPTLRRAYEADAKLEKAYGKIEGILRSYAAEKKIKYEELRVLHISDERGEIQSDLLRLIESAPLLPRQTEKRHRRYISEKESVIRRLIRVLTGVKADRAGGKTRPHSILLNSIPDYLKPLLQKLPHVLRGLPRNSDKQERTDSLTENGQLLLLAVCRVDADQNRSKEISTFTDLLLRHYRDVHTELRSLAPSPMRFLSSTKALYRLMHKLNLPINASTSSAVKVEDWPRPLLNEYNQYLQLAKGEDSSSLALRKSAAKHGFSLRTHADSTRAAVTASIGQMLAVIPHNGTLSIVDLIRLQPTDVMTEEGLSVESRNAIIDHVRELECAKSSKSKRINYDSTVFDKFLFAVTAMAARTGYGHLIKDFNRAYRVGLDEDSKQARKKGKKKGIKRKWINVELEKLGATFDVIIKTGLFRRIPGRTKKDADRAMRLCLFYPQILTMRFVGYRQQAIRGCITGKNIVFRPDGSIVLHFDEQEVKNRRTLHFEIKPTEGGTHERLRTVLIKYYKKVLPYIRSRGAFKAGNRFFVQFDGRSGQFRGFKDARDYNTFFNLRVAEFINTQDLAPHLRYAFNPHFLRGVCTDWMIYDLHMTFAEAARVLGDTEAVVRKDYADRNEVCDATPVFDKVNDARRTRRMLSGSADSTSSDKKVGKEVLELLKRMEHRIEVLTTTLDSERRQFENDVTALRVELSLARAANGAVATST